MFDRRGAGWWLSRLVAAGFLLAFASCSSIPTTAVTLSDELYQYQKQQVEHLGELAAAYDRVLEAESNRRVEPLVSLERRVEFELHALRGMLAVEASPAAPVPDEWAAEDSVASFQSAVRRLDTRIEQWAPWVERARTYRRLLAAMVPADAASFKKVALESPNSVQSVIIAGLTAAQADGKPLPKGADAGTLVSALAAFTGLDNDDLGARLVGDRAVDLIDDILVASHLEQIEKERSSLRTELTIAVGERQEILAEIQDTRREVAGKLADLRTRTRRDLEALQDNAAEIERGLDALSVGLRRGSEAVYRPKNDIVSGLKSLAKNLGELDVLDEEDVAKFSGKVDGLSTQFDSMVAKVSGEQE